jgi:hypothetical protein
MIKLLLTLSAFLPLITFSQQLTVATFVIDKIEKDILVGKVIGNEGWVGDDGIAFDLLNYEIVKGNKFNCFAIDGVGEITVKKPFIVKLMGKKIKLTIKISQSKDRGFLGYVLINKK